MARKLSQEFINDYYKERGYIVLSEYKDNRTPVRMKCPNGHITGSMTFYSFKKGSRCAVCSKKAKLTYEFVKEEFEKEGYSMISSDYKNANSKLKVLCPVGHTWEVTYAKFYLGRRCGHCDKSKKLTYEYVESEFKKQGYTLISNEYISANHSLVVKCENGHISDTMSYNNFQRGQGCKFCNKKVSKGEKEVIRILKRNNIKYVPEYRFDDCKFKYRLPFDFYLENHNTLIEYDGGQHFRPVELYGGEEGFELTKVRDEIKNKYCEEKNINLIRIPYWDFKNIENIILKELKIS